MSLSRTVTVGDLELPKLRAAEICALLERWRDQQAADALAYLAKAGCDNASKVAALERIYSASGSFSVLLESFMIAPRCVAIIAESLKLAGNADPDGTARTLPIDADELPAIAAALCGVRLPAPENQP